MKPTFEMLVSLRERLKEAEQQLDEAHKTEQQAINLRMQANDYFTMVDSFVNSALAAFKFDYDMKFDAQAEQRFLELIGHMHNETVGEK